MFSWWACPASRRWCLQSCRRPAGRRARPAPAPRWPNRRGRDWGFCSQSRRASGRDRRRILWPRCRRRSWRKRSLCRRTRRQCSPTRPGSSATLWRRGRLSATTRNYYIEAQLSKHLVGPPKETGKCQLTEEDGQVRGGAGQRFQRLGCYVFDHVLLLAGRVLVLHEPLEDVLLAQQIAFVDDWYAIAVVDQSGQRGEAVLFGQFLVGDFDESDAQLIGLVVNVLQFAQDLLALFALRPIWQSRRMRRRKNSKQQQKDVRLVIWPLLHVESHSSIRKYIEVIYRIGRRRSPYRGRSSPGFWRWLLRSDRATPWPPDWSRIPKLALHPADRLQFINASNPRKLINSRQESNWQRAQRLEPSNTFVSDGLLVAEISQGRVSFDVVLLRDFLVVNFDKVDTWMRRYRFWFVFRAKWRQLYLTHQSCPSRRQCSPTRVGPYRTAGNSAHLSQMKSILQLGSIQKWYNLLKFCWLIRGEVKPIVYTRKGRHRRSATRIRGGGGTLRE